MTETKRCCGKCISIYAGSVGCRLRLECPCHTTNMSPPCVCGNRGYSALMNNEHFPGCPCHKPVSEPLKYNTWIQHDDGKPTTTPPSTEVVNRVFKDYIEPLAVAQDLKNIDAPTEWEIRFNERFMTIFSLHTGSDTFKPVKEFIRTLLAEQKAELLQSLEEKVEETYQSLTQELANEMAKSLVGHEVLWEMRMTRLKNFRDTIIKALSK